VTSRSPPSIHLYLGCDGVARYKILLKAAAAREYEGLASKADRRRVLSKIGALTDDPRPTESSCLPECENHRRICLMHLRVIYRIDDFHKQVTVFRIAHRRRQNSTW
jgi:mRNA-degrading endonuclease RelE of RelBE toxin-antitoxin system